MASDSFTPVRPSAAIVAAICGAEILGLAGYSIVPALLPQFIEAWSLTNTQAGWLTGVVSAGYMVAVIPLVSLTDRRPARQIYLASSALSALSCFGMALCGSLHGKIDAQAGAVRPGVPHRCECGASGYPGRLQRQTARVIGAQNLSKLNVSRAIEKAQTKRAERCELTANLVIDELRKIAFANMADYISPDPPGGEALAAGHR